jgi:hypothetical protein
MRGNRSKRWVLFAGLVIASLGIIGCGKKSTTSTLPLPGPTNPGQQVYSGGSGDLGPNPGTPLRQTSAFMQIFQAMQQTLSGNKQANSVAQSSTAYAIESTYQSTYFRPISQPQQEPSQNGYYQYQGYGNSGGFQIVVYGSGEQSSYHFVFEVNVGGVILQSTDQIAMFQSDQYQGDIMKVAYRNQNPSLIRFRITQRPQVGFGSAQPTYQQYPNRGYSSVPQLMVYTQVLQVMNPYSQQQQYYGNQQQQYYGGQQQQQQYYGNQQQQQQYYPQQQQQQQQQQNPGYTQYPGQL